MAAESSNKYESFFEEADKDKSGTLTLAELSETLRKQGYTGADEDIKRFFTDMDFTGDKQITKEEFMIYMRQKPEEYHKSALLRQAFEAMDKDGSGEIDREELKAIFAECGYSISDREAKVIMDKADKDKSGSINYEEFITAVFSQGI